MYVIKLSPKNAGIKKTFAVLASSLVALPGLSSSFADPRSSSIVGMSENSGKHTNLKLATKKTAKRAIKMTSHKSILPKRPKRPPILGVFANIKVIAPMTKRIIAKTIKKLKNIGIALIGNA